MSDYKGWQDPGNLYSKRSPGATASERRRLGRLRADVVALQREVRETMDVDLSVATTVTAFFLLASVAGGFVRAHDCDVANFFDYLAYVFPVWAAWIVGLGLYVRKLLFGAFKISIVLLLAGVTSYFISKRLLAAFVGQWVIFVSAVIALILMFAPRKKGQPKRREGLTIFYGVLITFTITISVVMAVLWLPQPNDWFERSFHLVDYQPENTCKKETQVDDQHSEHQSSSGPL